MNVSIILPAYNEEANIGQVIDKVFKYMTSCTQVHMFEIIIVDDGSTDRTSQEVRDKVNIYGEKIRLVSHGVNKGYGSALRTGFAKARFEWGFYMDSDQQFNISDFTSFLDYISNHQSRKTGTYILSGIRVDRKDSFIRWLNARTYSLALRILFGLKSKDINCAFKLIPKSFLDSINLSSNGATINAELYYYAQKRKIAVIEIPVEHYPRVEGKQTGANIKVVCRAMWSLIQLRLWTVLK